MEQDELRGPAGGFPFPLTGGPNESPYLTWLRNHSKYMAVRGLLDYFQMAAVLVRGGLINNLVILPTLLVIALAISFVYSSLLDDWEVQRVPALGELLSARKAVEEQENRLQETKNGDEAKQALLEALLKLKDAKKAVDDLDSGKIPITFSITKPTHSDDVWLGLAKWMQDNLGLTPPFLVTPFVLIIVAVCILLFPIWMMLAKIAGHNKSLATGSDSSVKLRDGVDRFFGAALLVVLAVSLFELMPLMVHLYHQLRLRHLGGSVAL